jgi:hypothetical protein
MLAILATREAEIRRISVRSQPGQIALEILPRKYPSQKRTGGVAQMEEALSSNSSTTYISPTMEENLGPPGARTIKEGSSSRCFGCRMTLRTT